METMPAFGDVVYIGPPRRGRAPPRFRLAKGSAAKPPDRPDADDTAGCAEVGRHLGGSCAFGRRSWEAAMARPYSADLRERVLLAHEGGEGGATALARRFRLGLSTVYRWLDELRSEGRRAARPMGHGRAPLGGAEDVLRALAAEQNDATLAEYAERFAAPGGGAPRRSAAPCGGSTCGARKVAPGRRAGPPGRGGGPGGVASGACRDRAG